MRYQLNSCAMPGCKVPTERGKRLCDKHAATGKDMRIPKFVLATGLSKIYSTMQLQKMSFSVEDIMLALDPYYTENPDVLNNLNAMAKLFRTLRANNYIVKNGHRDGFVVYSLGQGWDKSNVTIEEEFKPQKNIKVEDGRIKISDKNEISPKLDLSYVNELEKKVKKLSETVEKDKANLEDFKNTTKSLDQQTIDRFGKALTELQNNFSGLQDCFANAQQEIAKLRLAIDAINYHSNAKNEQKCDCPIMQLREQMGVLFGGKKNERPKR